MATVKTPARALLPGDIVRDPFQGAQGHLLDRAVVLAVAFADPGPVGLQLGRLGPIPKHLDRVATVSWHSEHHVEVEHQPGEFLNQVALGLLADVQRLAAGGYCARVRIVHDEIEVSALEVHERVASMAARDPYSVQPTRCKCHPETCGCKPWSLKQGAATVTTFQDRDAAIETARRLNAP